MATEEIKEINREDCPDLSQAEVSRLRAEIRELCLKLEKANNKLTKKKNKLESERTNSNTLRQFIQELNNKVQQLERAPPPPPPSPLNGSIQSPQTPAMHPAVSEEFVQKLVMDKTVLESQMCEQKREIESLKSKLTQSTDTQQQRHTDLLLKEQQLEECKSNYLKLEGECQLGKQLFKKAQNSLSAEKEQLQQEVDWERDRNKKISKKMEEILLNKQQLEKQITELLESTAEYKKRFQELTNEMSFLQNTNKQLHEDLRKLETESNASIEELRETKEQQQQTIESNNKQHLSELREKYTSISKLANQLETLRTQFERERGDIFAKEIQLIDSKETIRNLEEKAVALEEKEKQLIELNATFVIMSKESNKLTEENENLKTKQQTDEQHIRDLHDSVIEHKKRGEELTKELSEIQASASVAKEGQFDSLMTENSKLQNTNKELHEDLKKLETESNASIEELRETKEQQQQTIESNNKQHLSEVREKDTSINKLANQLETLRTQLGMERGEMLLKENQLIELNETIRNLEGKVVALEEKEKQLNELNATFGIMSKESNKLTEENDNLKTKQQTDEQHIRDLHDSVIEHKKRGEELTKELSEIQASASVAKEGQFDSLMTENSKLQNTNKELHEDLKKLETESNASIEELRETKEQQQQTIESNNKQHLSEVREKDTSINKLANQLETLRTQLGMERGEMLLKENQLIELNETIRNLEGKVVALEEKEKQLNELNATFGIMSKESNKLTEENDNLKTKQQTDEQHIRDLHDSVIEHKKRGEELTKELSEIQASASVAKEGQFDSLMAENSKLQNTNKELHEDLKLLETESNASIEELRETKEQQQQTIESNNKQHLSEVREKDTSISKLANQLETLRTQFGRERDEMELTELNETIRNLEEKVVALEEKEKQLIELNATFGIMSKESNKLLEENKNLKTKQQTDGQQIRDFRREKRQQTIEHRSKHIGELVKEECTFILKTKELLTSQDIALYYSTWQYMKTESDLIFEIKLQKQELEEYKALFSKKHKNTDLVISLISEKSLLKQSIEELRELKVKLTTEKTKQHEILALKGELHIANNCIIKLKQISLSSEERLKGRIDEIEKANKELRGVIKILNKQTSQQNEQIPTAGGAQEEKEKSTSLLQTKDEQISELTVQILDLKSFETTFHDFTPHIVPVANNTRKIPYKILLRTNVNHVKVVKLNAFPNPDEYQGKQAILSINKHYELGVIMVIFELPSKDGLKTVSLKYVGIKLNDPMGNSDGEFRTKHYFECGPNCGIFAPFEDVFIPVV